MMSIMENEEVFETLASIHLQWFAEDDDEEDGVEIDEEEDEEEDDIPILVEGRDEIPEEDDSEEEGPSREDLLRELEEIRSREEANRARLEDKETLSDGFQKLSQILEQQNSAQSQQQQSQETWDDVKKRLKDSFYDDPVAAMEEAMKYMVKSEIAPAFQELHGTVSKTAMATSRQMAAQNPTNKTILEKYGDEVEAAVKSLPPGPDVYERACQQVGMQHFTDIVQASVQEAMGAAASSSKTSRPSSNMNPSGSSGSRGASPKKKAKRRVLTAAQREAADKMGLSYDAAWSVFNE